LRKQRRRADTQERCAGGDRAQRDLDPLRRNERGIKVRLRGFERGRCFGEPLRERRDALGERRVLADERVVRATRDGIGVERGLASPARERTNRALTTQVRDDQSAVDAVGREEIAVGETLEFRQPLVVEAVARRESLGGEITEAMVVGVDAGDGCCDGIERVAPVDEGVGVLAEARGLERLSAVGAELGVARVRPSAVAAVDRGPRCDGRRRRRRSGGHRCRFVVRRFIAEAAHALAELAKHVGQLPCPEDDQHDREDEKKLGSTNIRHRSLPREACSLSLDLPSVRISLDEEPIQ
jgi:hypothetical protein